MHVVSEAQVHRLLRDQQSLEDEPFLRVVIGLVLLGALQRQNCVDRILAICDSQAIFWLVTQPYGVCVVADRLEDEKVLLIVFCRAFEPFNLLAVDSSGDCVRNTKGAMLMVQVHVPRLFKLFQ